MRSAWTSPPAARPSAADAEAVRWAWRTAHGFTASMTPVCSCANGSRDDAVNVFCAQSQAICCSPRRPVLVRLSVLTRLPYRCKVAVVDGTGRSSTPGRSLHQPRNQWDQSRRHSPLSRRPARVELIAIGNGTASRETDALATELVAEIAATGHKAPAKVTVSEAGGFWCTRRRSTPRAN